MHATTAPKVRGPGANPLPPALIIRIGGRRPDGGRGEADRPRGGKGASRRAQMRQRRRRNRLRDAPTRAQGASARPPGWRKLYEVSPFAAQEAEKGRRPARPRAE